VNGSCTELVEDCLNGIDDDRDGDKDCADSDCNAGYTCATTPAGWTGPVALWSGAIGSAPNCGGAYSDAQPLQANGGLNVPSYTCPTCNCTPNGGATCDPLDVKVYTGSSCTGITYNVTAVGTTCKTPMNFQTNGVDRTLSAEVVLPTERTAGNYAHGTCTPSQAAPSFPSPSWATEMKGCGASEAGGYCQVGQCMPKPAAPFNAELCIYRSGQATCPSTYPNQRPNPSSRYYLGWTDNRDCGCACGALQCGGEVRMYTDSLCSDNATVLPADGMCSFLGPDPTENGDLDSRSARSFNTGPVCGAGANSLTGSVQPATPVTVCCQ
jgi:hypothetical protein